MNAIPDEIYQVLKMNMSLNDNGGISPHVAFLTFTINASLNAYSSCCVCPSYFVKMTVQFKAC